MDADQINLGKLFRPDSAARGMAEVLLSGKRVSRTELSEQFNVSVTSVNRVVRVLEEQGCTITREVDHREAFYQVREINLPMIATRLPSLRQEAKLVRTEMFGEGVVLDFTLDDSRYRGQVKSIQAVPPLGSLAMVTGVTLIDDEHADVVLTARGKKLVVADVQNVTPHD